MPLNNPAIAAHVTALNTFVGQINTGLDGLDGDIAGLKKALEDINNSPGVLSPEDQASLDSALGLVASAATKAQALDDLTPPVVPTPTP